MNFCCFKPLLAIPLHGKGPGWSCLWPGRCHHLSRSPRFYPQPGTAARGSLPTPVWSQHACRGTPLSVRATTLREGTGSFPLNPPTLQPVLWPSGPPYSPFLKGSSLGPEPPPSFTPSNPCSNTALLTWPAQPHLTCKPHPPRTPSSFPKLPPTHSTEHVLKQGRLLSMQTDGERE